MQLIEDSDRAEKWLAPWCGGSKLFNLWDMKEFEAHLLFTYARNTEGLYELLKRLERINAAGRLTEEEGKKLFIVTKFRAESCDDLQLPASKKSCEEIMDVINKDACPYARDFRPLLLELNKRIEVELKAHAYFYISKERSRFYQMPLEGWEVTRPTSPCRKDAGL